MKFSRLRPYSRPHRHHFLAIFIAVLVSLVAFQNCSNGFTASRQIASATSAQSDPNGTAGSGSWTNSGVSGFSCQNPSYQSATPLKRLNKNQYINTLISLFGNTAIATVQPELDTLPNDMAFEAASTYVKEFYESTVQTFTSIALELAAKVAVQNDLQILVGDSCLNADALTSDCMTLFISKAGAKIWRRPLTNTEIAAVKAVSDLGANKQEQIAAVIEVMLQSPNFTYIVEQGTGGEGTKTSPLQLSDYEIASRLSYFIWDSMPDQILFNLAAQGSLHDPMVQSAQVDRMFLDAKAQLKVGQFTKFWLALNGTSHSMRNFPTSPAVLVEGIDGTALKTEVIREVQEYVNYVVFQKNGNYADLMSSNASFARTDDLAGIYGHETVTGSAPAMMSARKGLLMRPMFLANSVSQTSPIIRGVRMRSRILCMDAVAPGVDVTSQGPDISSEDMIREYSTRQRYDMKIAGAACAGCHSTINPFGNAFEKFDAFGRLRPIETDYRDDGSVIAIHAIDTAVQVNFASSVATVTGADDLQTQIGAGTQGQSCLAKQTFRFYQLQTETPDDGCSLASMYTGMTAQNGTILGGLKQFVLTNLTTKRVN